MHRALCYNPHYLSSRLPFLRVTHKVASRRLSFHFVCRRPVLEPYCVRDKSTFTVFRKTQTNMTPLILAASAGREKVVNTLLNEGANVNATTVDGHSALQYAASKNWKSICVTLLEKDADVNIADKRGATPLHRSASKGNTVIVKLLIEYGKNLDIGR